MMPVPSPFLRRSVFAALTTLALGSATLRAGSELIEVQGRFVRATAAQIDKAFDAAKISKSSTVLDAKAFEIFWTALKENGGEVFSEPRALTTSGYRANVEAVREVKYPVEYERSEKDPGKSIPVEFETRNVGVILDVEVVAGPGGKIDLTSQSSVTQFLGFIDYSVAKPAGKGLDSKALDELLKAPLSAGGIWQPIFTKFEVKVSFILKDGETALLGGPLVVEPGKIEPKQPEITAAPSDRNVFIFLTPRIVRRD